jgi:hypothetical protein
MVKKEKKGPTMTKVKYSCGHEQDINLTGTKAVQAKKIDRKLQKSLCRDCHKAKGGAQ